MKKSLLIISCSDRKIETPEMQWREKEIQRRETLLRLIEDLLSNASNL